MSTAPNPFDNVNTTSTHYLWTFIAALGDFLDAGMFAGTGITLLAISQFLHFTTFEAGLPALITLLGTAFGALVFGVFGDKFGRKYIYWVTVSIHDMGVSLLCLNWHSSRGRCPNIMEPNF